MNTTRLAAGMAALSFFGVAYGVDGGYDTRDGMVTVDGQRTFIIGSYYAGSKGSPDRPLTESYEELAGAGFNLVHTSPSEVEQAHRSGLMGWVTVGAIDLEKRDESAKAIGAAVDQVKDEPG